VSFALMIGVGLLAFLAALPLVVTVVAGTFQGLPAMLGGLLVRVRHGL